MVPVSFVLFARQATGSFASASLVLAALTAGRLLLSPRRGRMVDRLGPCRALLWLLPGATATDIAFILAGRAHPDPLLLIAVAAISGAVTAPAATVMRSVWAALLPDSGLRRTGFALMSVIGEVTFFTGPLLAGILIATGSPTLAVAVGAALNAAGTLALALSSAARSVAPHPPTGQTGRLPALAGAGVRYVVGISALFGLTFGLLDVAWPAFARTHGSIAAAGLFLSLFALGAGVGGLLYGALKHHRSAIALYPRLCLLAAAGLALVPAAGSVLTMSIVAVISGLCFAPITTVQVAAVDEVSPEAHRAEAFTWVGTVYGVGSALGAALAGQLIVQSGDRAALIAAAGATAAAWLLATRLQSRPGLPQA
jgi:MFS family permease